MKRFLTAGVALVALALTVGAALPAGATQAPAGYGFDGKAHVIVGGGSDTTYFAMLTITDLYNRSGVSSGCPLTTATGPNLGNCTGVDGTGTVLTNDLGNWDHDSVAQANPVGSGGGIGSLNHLTPAAGAVVYNGSVNAGTPSGGNPAVGGSTGPNVDFARSSRGPRAPGDPAGNPSTADGTNELNADTFWGYGQDGIQVFSFNNRGSQLQGGTVSLTPAQLKGIYDCSITSWSQIGQLGIAPGSATDGPIVPWGMNTASGTYSTMNSYIATNNSLATFNVNAGSCVRPLSGSGSSAVYPFENDVKPIINAPAALSSTNTSIDNPENWLWFGSFGTMSAFPYQANATRGIAYVSKPARVGGTTGTSGGRVPSTANIGAGTYPIGRTLYHVTRKADADCPKTGGSCDFGIAGPTIAGGGTDLNVVGGTSGTSGAVREFTRFLCRPSTAQQKNDPYTGVNYFTEISGAVAGSGFTGVPLALVSAGTSCQVLS